MIFWKGFRAMIPIAIGVIPFGMVMGTVTSEAGLSFLHSTVMNIIVFAGASQLAAVDLMTQKAAIVVVVITGLIINLRFLLYSAAMVPILQGSGLLTKMVCAYSITDQNYAVMSAYENILKTREDKVRFYLGASLCMFLNWQFAVMAGFMFGNIAPASLSLDYAIPLSFVALTVPTLKNRKYMIVAGFSAVVSLILYSVPYRLGLILTTLLGILLAAYLTRKKKVV